MLCGIYLRSTRVRPDRFGYVITGPLAFGTPSIYLCYLAQGARLAFLHWVATLDALSRFDCTSQSKPVIPEKNSGQTSWQSQEVVADSGQTSVAVVAVNGVFESAPGQTLSCRWVQDVAGT